MTVMIERPTIRPPTQPTSFDELTELLEELDVPEGFRAEIFGGSIVVTPWSQGYYLDIMDSLVEQLRPHLPEGHRISQAPCLYVFPEASRAYGPDVHVADAQATRIRSYKLPGHALSLVAELTSPSSADKDGRDKVERYGKSGVPVYLLVDMLQESLMVYAKPDDHGYRVCSQVTFGEKVHIPEPFDCELDTSGWES
jgi:Uma2 family endonuclease